MAIRVRCECSRIFDVPDELGGKWAACPSCWARVLVEVPEPRREGPSESGEEGGPHVRCAGCGAAVPAGLLICLRCGGHPFTGGRATESVTAPRREERKEIGLFRLCLNMLVHPLRTSDELLYWLSTPQMLVKTMVFFVSGLVVWMLPQLLMLEGRPGVLPGLVSFVALVFGGMLGVALSALLVAVIGWLFTDEFEYLALLVGFCFLEGLVRWTTVALSFAVAAGAIGGGGGLGVIVFAWALALKLLLIWRVFGTTAGTFLLEVCFVALQAGQILLLWSVFGPGVGTGLVIILWVSGMLIAMALVHWLAQVLR